MSTITAIMERAATNAWHPLVYDLLALLIIVLFAWRGWRRGIVRELSGILSIVGSVLLAQPFGMMLLPYLPLENFPSMLRNIAASTVGGLLAYPVLRLSLPIVASLLGLLRQRTGKLGAAMHAGGAIIGGLFGTGTTLVLGWSILSMGQLTAILPPMPEATDSSTLLLLPTRFATAHRESLAASMIGKVAAITNPIPEKTMESAEVLIETMQDPEGIRRIAEFAPVAKLLVQKPVQEFAGNAEILALAAKGDLIAIMNHPAFRKLMEDPAVQESLHNLDVAEIVEFLKSTRHFRRAADDR